MASTKEMIIQEIAKILPNFATDVNIENFDFVDKKEDDALFKCFDRYLIKKADVYKNLLNSKATDLQ